MHQRERQQFEELISFNCRSGWWRVFRVWVCIKRKQTIFFLQQKKYWKDNIQTIECFLNTIDFVTIFLSHFSFLEVLNFFFFFLFWQWQWETHTYKTNSMTIHFDQIYVCFKRCASCLCATSFGLCAGKNRILFV